MDCALTRRGQDLSDAADLGLVLVQLAHKLFDVTVEAADGKVPVWHKDVRFFSLKAAGKPKAYFYLGACRRACLSCSRHASICLPLRLFLC